MSYVRTLCPAGGGCLLPRCARILKRGTTVPRDPPHRDRRACESLRQELNPHLGRTKGACLPLTLRRRDVYGDGGSRTRNLPGASGLLCHSELHPRGRCWKWCGRMESNHHSAGHRVYSAGSSPDAQRIAASRRRCLLPRCARILKQGTYGSAVTLRLERDDQQRMGDRPDSNRYREDHDLGCCRYTTATMETGTTGLEPATSRLTSDALAV